MRTPAISLLLGFLPAFLYGQVGGILSSLPQDELQAIQAIALYPPTERAALLQVAMYPEVLVRMDHLRQQTETAFVELIASLNEEDQAMMYNLSRYPDLVDTLCGRAGQWPIPELKELLSAFPEEIQEDARQVNRKHFDLLKNVNALDKKASADFYAILAGYSPAVQDAAIRLSHLPAVATVMRGNLALTILLGDIYRRNPKQLEYELDSLSIVVAEAQAREVKAWKEDMEKNPAAKAEFEQAAKDFAGAYAYDDDMYAAPSPEPYRDEVYLRYIWQPYSYWFGWPYWYPYECWFPYPWWYHWGFYFGPGQQMVFIGMPSNYFFHWYFGYDPHFYNYPHCTDEVIRHYYGPRTSGIHLQPVLREWQETHRQELPESWWNDDGHRVDRIREYGRFKLDYTEAAAKNLPDTPTPREFLEQHADRYPSLKPILKEQPAPTIRKVPAQPRPSETPAPRPGKAAATSPAHPADSPAVPAQEKIDRARAIHENAWSPPRQVPAVQKTPNPPPTRIAPKQAPKTTPTRQVPKRKD